MGLEAPAAKDESLIRQQLALSPGERLRELQHQVAGMRRLVGAGARARERRA
jgi:hypothetical protein